MSVQQFTGTTVLSILNQQLECSNYQSVQITNNSNYGFTLSNVGNRTVIGYVNPWENIIMPLDGIATLGIVVNNSLNSATPFSPIQTQELLQVQFSRLTVMGTSKTSSAVITSTNITSSGTLNVQFNGTQDVQFPSAQDVNLAANNAGTLDVQFPSAQDVNLAANNAGTLDVQFPSAQDINIAANNSGPIDVTIDSSGNTVEVAGTVNNNIINDNVPIGGAIQLTSSFSIPSGSAGTAFTTTVALPQNRPVKTGTVNIALFASNSSSNFDVTVTGYYLPVNTNLIDIQSGPAISWSDVAPNSYHTNPISMYTQNVEFTANEIVVSVTPISSATETTTVEVDVILNGQTADIINQTIPIATFPASSGGERSVYISSSTIGDGATIDFIAMNRIYAIYAWSNGSGVLRLQNSNGAWLGFFMSSFWNMNLEGGYYDNGGYTVELYNTSTATQYYTLWIVYE